MYSLKNLLTSINTCLSEGHLSGDRKTDIAQCKDRQRNQSDILLQELLSYASCKNQTKTMNDIYAMYTHYPQKIIFIKNNNFLCKLF